MRTLRHGALGARAGALVVALLVALLAALLGLGHPAQAAQGVGGTASPGGPEAPAGAAVQPLDRDRSVLVTTGRVNCLLVNSDSFTGVRCDAPGADFGAPRPDDCHADWGATLVLKEYGVATWGCVGDSLQNRNRLRDGRSVELGSSACTAVGRAVRCRSTTSGYGFFLSPKRFDLLNRGGRKVLSPRGIDGLKPGMTVDEALETKTIEAAETGCSGAPAYDLKPKYKAYLVWRGDEVLSLNAWSNGVVRTTRGIGVGSTMRAVAEAYPALGKPRKSGNGEWDLYWVRTISSGPYELHFFFSRSIEERRLWAGDPVTAMVATRTWKPSEGLDYHGCDTAPAARAASDGEAPPAVTAVAEATDVEVGQTVRITASLASGEDGVRVVLQRKSGKTWSEAARKKSSSDGEATFVLTATKAGRSFYRVLVPATGDADKAVSERLRIDTYRWRYLTDMDWHEDGDWESGVATINGKRFPESVYADNIFWGDLEVNLGGKCTRLAGVAGLTDDSDTGTPGALTVFQDGAEIYYSELTMTQSQTLDLAIDGALRLGFRNHDLGDSSSTFPVVGVGNAEVYCRS